MASCSNKSIPPDVKKIPKEIKTHGHVRTDNYYWMRLTDEQKSAKKYDSQTQDVINYIDVNIIIEFQLKKSCRFL